jgi:hypothetical protein
MNIFVFVAYEPECPQIRLSLSKEEVQRKAIDYIKGRPSSELAVHVIADLVERVEEWDGENDFLEYGFKYLRDDGFVLFHMGGIVLLNYPLGNAIKELRGIGG